MNCVRRQGAVCAGARSQTACRSGAFPSAVKDNIDVAGLPTTAACPAFAYHPERGSTVVARLKAAGALVIGKTNLDQFATGLQRHALAAWRAALASSTRITCRAAPSSGSAVAVARPGEASALGTDTARAPVACRRPSTISSASNRRRWAGAECRRRARLPQRRRRHHFCR